MAHLSICVLGGLSVSKADKTVSSFESDKVRALLAYLVAEAGRPHPRESLVGLLWPDFSEKTAHHNLSQALFNLRKVLGDHIADPPYLRITHDAIQFNPESDYALDLQRFNAGYFAWEKSRGDIALLEDMVALYRGEFLHGFSLKDSAAFEEWILVQRALLHQRVMNALAALAQEFEIRADFQAARRFCLRQLELDPWREEAHCHLMRLLALDGQRSAALAQYETCRTILAGELGVEPSPATRDLYQQIRLGKIKPQIAPTSQISAPLVHKLPLPLAPFLGRQKELAELDRLISTPHCRCISLVGPGGIGKTRLALQAAERNKDKFAHGAAFIPLVSVRSSAAAVSAIASGIGYAFHGPLDPRMQLLANLGDKHMLLILDNVEHLLVEGPDQELITDLILEILHQAPQVKLLVTSREALNIAVEWFFPVQGLDYPDVENGAENTVLARGFSSVALFLQHARRVRPGFEMDADNQTGLARLCRLVEGMPLAIELAAAWVRILSVDEIVAEIERSLDFLTAQMRDIPARHRSMRAVFDQSWEMLSSEEKQILSRLSVFRGGFGRHAAEQVAGASLLVLSSLVARSLVRRTLAGRYDLHELVRQYAASKLVEDPNELHRVQELHSLHYLGFLEQKDPLLRSHQQKAALKELAEEIHNLREAWDWAAKNHRVASLYRASPALWYLFELQNWFKEGELTFRMTSEALRAAPPVGLENVDPELAGYAMLAHRGCFMFRQGKSEAAYAVLAPCVDHLKTAQLQTRADPLPVIYSLGYLGVVCWELGKFSEAIERLQEGLSLASAHPWYAALLNEDLGVVANDRGEYPRARQYLSQALDLFRRLGDPSFTAHTLSYLGRTLHALGEYPEAEKLLRQSLEIARQMDYRFGIGLAQDALGQLAYAREDYPEAQTLFSESAALFEEIGDTHRLARTLNHQGMTALALNQPLTAQNAFTTALTLARAGGLTPIALSALAGLAALQVRSAQNVPPPRNQQTLELVLSILQHPLANQATKELARRLQPELEVNLPLQVVEAAHHNAGEKDPHELVCYIWQ